MHATDGKILIEGNTAAAIGCLMAGVTVVAWYPITPSSSLCESLIDLMRKYRIDKETGKATFAIVQAEDEIAALGMVIGASWAGARAMTSTSGPGISLMGEFTGLGYYAEIPAVIFDIQRVGPSTGLPTRTAQGDILSTALLSHGDTRHPMLLPSSVAECYEMAIAAFDLSERLQTPVFVMSDLDLGMNIWMADPFPYPDGPIDRGKVLDEVGARASRRVGPLQGRGRRRDPVAHAAGHEHAGLLRARIGPQREGPVQRARRRLPAEHGAAGAQVRHGSHARADARSRYRAAGARVGLIAYGTSHWAIVESRDQLRDEAALETSYLRLKAFPFTERPGRLHRPPRSRLRGRAEPRRADAGADAHGTRSGARREAAQRAALQRSADRRAEHHRRRAAQEGLAMARAASEPTGAPHAAGVGRGVTRCGLRAPGYGLQTIRT